MRRFPAAGARRFATLNHDALHALDSHLVADPVRAGLPAAAVRGRKVRLAELMGEEPYRALTGRRLVTPPSRSLPPELARAVIAAATRARQAGKARDFAQPSPSP